MCLLAIVTLLVGASQYQSSRSASLVREASSSMLEESARLRLKARGELQAIRIQRYFMSIPEAAQLVLQAGMMGLIEASRSYDAEQGASFETYASIRIRGAMIDEIRRGDWVPRSVHRRAREAASAIREIEQSSGRAASAQEVAAKLDLPLGDYQRLLEDAARGQVLSLDSHIEDHGEVEPVNRGGGPTPQDALVRGEFGRELVNAIGHLPEVGEELTLGRFAFRVTDADSRRLHALHVSVHADD